MNADHTIWPAAYLPREAELSSLQALLPAEESRLLFLHGLSGIGKSTLLRAFARASAPAYPSVHLIDAAQMKPTEAACG